MTATQNAADVHSICADCWCWLHPRAAAEPVRLDRNYPEQLCCFCGERHRSGIYVRLLAAARIRHAPVCQGDH